MANRADIVRKIRVMMAKTTANGCSEQEAISAAEMVQRLLHEYNISAFEVEDLHSDRFGCRSRRTASGTQSRRYPHVKYCWPWIARLTNTRVWISGHDLVFFGANLDTELAFWLSDTIQESMEQSWNFQKLFPSETEKIHGKTRRNSFLTGMAIRINQRLETIMLDREIEAMKAAQCSSSVADETESRFDRDEELNENDEDENEDYDLSSKSETSNVPDPEAEVGLVLLRRNVIEEAFQEFINANSVEFDTREFSGAEEKKANAHDDFIDGAFAGNAVPLNRSIKNDSNP